MNNFLKNYRFPLILLGSMLLGGIIGGTMGEKASVFSPIASLFLNLLYCCVVPMIFVSLISSIAKMQDLKKLGKMLIIMAVIFISTQLLASIYMSVVVSVFDPAKGVVIGMHEVIEDLTSSKDFLAMFTVNDYPLLWSRRNLMALIVFTMFMATATVAVGEKAKPFINLMESVEKIIMKMVSYVMYLAPLGLGAFFAVLIGEQGSELVGPLSRAIIIYMIAAVAYFFAANSLFAFIGGGSLGLRRYWENIFPLAVTALGTSSSGACIPLNLIAAKKIGVPDSVADISIPLGTNLHMDGACLITILKIAFLCSLYGQNFLEPKTLFTAIFVSVIASTVMGAIPGGGYVGEIFIISAFNFPPESIPIMVLIGTITDAPATAINATGQTSASMIIARFTESKNWLKNDEQIA